MLTGFALTSPLVHQATSHLMVLQTNDGESPMRTLKMLDVCCGIGGFTYAAKQVGNIETICTSETDSYNVKFIDRNLQLDNCGDASLIGVSEGDHPYAKMIEEEDIVPSEVTGFTSLTYQDFLEGVVDWPDIYCSGFPCQDVSQANTQSQGIGIDGEKSGLVHSNLDSIETLEVPYCVFENSNQLPKRGLPYILKRLSEMGYIVEWEIVSAVHFGFPHYRKRCYVAAYLPDTAVAKSGKRIFDSVRRMANKEPNHTIPLAHEDPDYIISAAVVEDTRSIKLRTKRLNSLGNTIIPAIATGIFKAITDAEKALDVTKAPKPRKGESYVASLLKEGWGKVQVDLFDESTTEYLDSIPDRGIMINRVIYSGEPDPVLNPCYTKYTTLYSTLLSRDGNNNFTTRSRLNRPGKLGGLIGDIMRLGVDVGGLHPEFAEQFMGYPRKYTELAY